MSHYGIVVALAREAKPLTKRRLPLQQVVSLSSHLSVMVAGMGERQARFAAEQLYVAGCTHLISWGVAAGVDPQLAAGDLILPSIVFNEAGDWVDCDEKLIQAIGEQVRAFVLPLLSTNAVIATAADKTVLFATKAVAAIDRESFAIGHYAGEQGLGFSAIRSIVDAVDCTLPPAALRAYDEQGKAHWLRFTLDLLRQPSQIPDLWRLASAMKLALSTLREVALLELDTHQFLQSMQD